MRVRELSILAVTLLACGDDPPAPAGATGGSGGSQVVCTPFQQVACACSGGETGVQICMADGAGFGPCTGCEGSGGQGGGVPDCGDGVVDAPEPCDDGNAVLGDGCDQYCAIELGWSCGGQPSVCTPNCGDGAIVISEACDDGNVTSGDGCDAACATEAGFSCGGAPSLCEPQCGDGITVGAETCDDGDLDPADGCGPACVVELGWDCAGSPSSCLPICGDGIILPGEACDDAGANADDGDCTTQCQLATCGDGFVHDAGSGTEECDDGQANNGPGKACKVNCILNFCGDGDPSPTDACDDGNQDNSDACINTCDVASCGDGHIWSGKESCDDGNTANCDGCETCEPRHWLAIPKVAAGAGARTNDVVPLSALGSVCFEAWALVPANQFGVYLTSTTPAEASFALRCTSGTVDAFVYNAAGSIFVTAAVGCDDGAWHHVAACRETTGADVAIKVFWDGQPVASGTGLASKIGIPTQLTLNGYEYGFEFNSGMIIDEVRVSDTLRYASAFVPVRRFTTDASTVALYHLDEGSGTLLVDASGNGHHGLLTSSSWAIDSGYAAAFCP